MGRDPRSEIGPRSTAVPTPDELVVHLREAGAKCVYLARDEAFRDGTIPVTATYEFDDDTDIRTGTDTRTDRRGTPETETAREMLESVFEGVGDRIQFHDRQWVLEWSVEPAYDEPQLPLVPLYDRRVERRHGDGYNLQNLRFVYAEQQEQRS